MVTKEQAVAARHGQEFHFGECTRKIGPRGGETIKQVRVRVSGACQTWKTRPEDFRLPVKYGMYEHSAIQPYNAAQFHTAADCPLNSFDKAAEAIRHIEPSHVWDLTVEANGEFE